MSGAATDTATTLGAPPPTAKAATGTLGYGPGQLVSTVEQAVRQKEADQGPIVKGMMDQAAKDKAQVEKATANYKPYVPTPAPATPQTDPMQAFGSAAGLFAMIASTLSHTPAVAAMNSMAGAINAAKANDWETYKANYDKWKDETQAAVEAHRMQAEDMKVAMEAMQTNLATGAALMKVVAAKSDDRILAAQVEQGAWEKVQQLGMERQRLAMSMQEHAMEVDKYMSSQTPLTFAQRELAQAHQALAEAKTPEQQQAAQAKVDAATQKVFGIQVEEARIKNMSSLRPGTPAYTVQAAHDKLVRDNPTMDDSEAWQKARDEVTRADVAAKQPVSTLNPDALDTQADLFNATHQLPVGYRNAPDARAIMNRAAERAKEQGLKPGDLLSSAAGQRAASTSLTNLTKISDAAKSYERSATDELNLAVSLIPKTPEPLNSQLFTEWGRQGSAALGGVDVPKYQAALISALDEYAKVLTGATGAAGSTDTARNQALALIPPGATSDQIPAIVEVLKQGMRFKVDEYDTQLADIRKRIGGGAGSVSAPKPPANDGWSVQKVD